jgi:hypothetical protein
VILILNTLLGRTFDTYGEKTFEGEYKEGNRIGKGK